MFVVVKTRELSQMCSLLKFSKYQTFIVVLILPVLHWNTRATTTHIATDASKLPKSCLVYMGILSRPSSKEARDILREYIQPLQATWLHYRFFIGRTRQLDMKEETDLFVVNRYIDYNSILLLSYAVIKQGFLDTQCKFIMKTDDDSFVNLIQLKEILTKIDETKPDAKLYLGDRRKKSRVILDPSHKYHNLPFYAATNLTRYPSFMAGLGYILSRSLAEEVVAMDQSKLLVTPLEDVTVGYWLSKIPHEQVHLRGMYPHLYKLIKREARIDDNPDGYRKIYKPTIGTCDKAPLMVVHGLSPVELKYFVSRHMFCEREKMLKHPKHQYEE